MTRVGLDVFSVSPHLQRLSNKSNLGLCRGGAWRLGHKLVQDVVGAAHEPPFVSERQC